MRALVLAAGLGTRIAALSQGLPKPLLPIGGEPLLGIILRHLVSHGVREVAINLHYRADAIREFAGAGERFGARIEYSFEPELRGTAGAIYALRSFLGEGSFIVYCGDVWTNADLGRLIGAHRHSGAALTMLLAPTDRPTEVGLVATDAAGRVTRFEEKPAPERVFSRLKNGGVLVCEPSVLACIDPSGPSDIGRDLIPRVLATGNLIHGSCLRSEESLIDIGSPDAYRVANESWSGRGVT